MIADFQRKKYNKEEESLVQYFKRNINEIDHLNVSDELKEEMKSIFLVEIKESIVTEKSRENCLLSKQKNHDMFLGWLNYLIKDDLDLTTYAGTFKTHAVFDKVFSVILLHKDLIDNKFHTTIAEIYQGFKKLKNDYPSSIANISKSKKSSNIHDYISYSLVLGELIVKLHPVIFDFLSKDLSLYLFFNKMSDEVENECN